jgi:3-hydroxyisobutyrate dehydrogenase-like beta-hydroxyacid dehydrogenase
MPEYHFTSPESTPTAGEPVPPAGVGSRAMLRPVEHLGFVGLGAMGAGIARRIGDAGHELTVWNRTRAKAEPLLEAGMRWGESPRAVAAAADVVFTMLTDGRAIAAAADGDAGILAGLRPGTVWADLSTIAPDASVALAERARERGAFFLDCPVSGSPATLAAGQMSVMAGGDRRAFEHVEPVLRAIGPKVTYIGANGHAILAKVAINLALVVSITALAEGVALVEKAGVEREAVVDAVLKSVIASPVVEYRAPLLVDDTGVFADVDLQQKDLVLAQELARRLGASVPTCSAASEMLSAARSTALRDRDFLVSVHEAYRRLAGTA